MKSLFHAFLFLFLNHVLLSQNLIEKLNFLQGNWTSEKWGGIIEEYWSAPNGNTLIGMFRFIKDGELQFSEHFMVTEQNNTLTLKLRHFNPDFTGWEDQYSYVEFPLVNIEENFVEFDGISYQLTNENRLIILLEMGDAEKIETEEFILKKF
ncbi:MAG: DUF6265 family protein [Melioribacteraceae bacterium]|nr:DUF6265 family protein [Melioribacteraceae bacterium]